MGKVLFTTLGLFSGLGAYRGVKYYGFRHKQNVKKYEKDLKDYPNLYKNIIITPKYYTSDAIAIGFMGFVLYANPVTALFMFYNEIHRLEINLRGYDEEKEKEEYYKFF